MALVYFLLLICSMTYAFGDDSLAEANHKLSDAVEAELHGSPAELSGGLNGVTASLDLASELPKSRRFNLARARSSARSHAQVNRLISDLRAHRLSRGDAEGALSDLSDRLASRKKHHGFIPGLSRMDDNIESDLEAVQRSDKEQLNRALLSFADQLSRNAQEAKELSGESKNRRNTANNNVEISNQDSDLENDAKVNARMASLLLEATRNAARSSSLKSDLDVSATEKDSNRRAFDGNANFDQLLRDAVNNIAKVTQSNNLNRRSSATSVLDAEVAHQLHALNELTSRLSRLQEADARLDSLIDDSKLGWRSDNSGASAYENALNEAIQKMASINDANRKAWGWRRSLDSGLAPPSDAPLSIKEKERLSSDAPSERSCACDEGNKKAEDDANRRSQSLARPSNLKKRSAGSLHDQVLKDIQAEQRLGKLHDRNEYHYGTYV